VSNLLYTIPAFLIAISILVVVHEFGHFWVARSLGVKVLRFSVGFGKPIWLRRFGPDRTEWVIAAIPMGGYVKMLDEQEGDVPVRDLPRAFNRQPIWKRTLIVLAGPAFNFLFAIGAYSAMNVAGMEGIRPVVGRVAESSLAEQAGFRPGDVIRRIDDSTVQSWDERRLYLYERALDRAVVRFEVRDRDGLEQVRRLDLSSLSPSDVGAGLVDRQIGMSPKMPEIPPVIGSLEEQGPARRAGISVGDRVLAINNEEIRDWTSLVKAVSSRPDETLTVLIETGGQQRTVSVTTQVVESNGRRIGRIGAGVRIPEMPADMLVTVRYPPWQALREGLETTWRMSVLTLKMLAKMLVLEVSTKTISGPLTIAQVAGASAQIGFSSFVLFLAVVSVSLGVLNLLPIPVLDGGHLLYYAIEGVTRRPISERMLLWGQQVGIALLAALMALAFYNDLMRLFF